MNKFAVILTDDEINLIRNMTYVLEDFDDSPFADQLLKDLRKKFDYLERVNE